MMKSAALLASLYSVTSPTSKRVEILKDYFKPSAGSMIKIDPYHNLDAEDHFLDAPLYVEMSPPKNYCFTAEHVSGVDIRDEFSCKKTTIFFKLKEINPRGELQLRVITNKKDSGTILSWKTPYRMARVTELGKGNTDNRKRILIKDCRVVGPRKINLELFSGDLWRIQFPKKDIPAKKDENEYPDYQKENTQNNSDDSVIATMIDENQQRKSSEDKESYKRYKFTLPYKNSFEMPVDNFKTSSFISGLKGMCRYRYKNAIGDPDSGIIECYNLDNYDSIIVPLSCTKNLIKE